MRRAQLVLLMAVAGAALALLALSTLTSPGSLFAAPLAQATAETEPNDSCGEANEITLGVPLDGAINPITDVDWFTVTTTPGLPYIATASMGAPDLRVRMCLYADDGMGGCAYVNCSSASNDNVSRSWTASGSLSYLKIEEFDPTTDTLKTASYTLEVVQQYVSPTPTASNTPTATPLPTNTPLPTAAPPTAIPGADQYEPNHDFDTATTLATGVTYSANFIPYGGGQEDNDFYKLWIKPGLHFICETSNLAPGVDTNMIVYDGNGNAVGGNDDKQLGEYGSYFAYYSTYEGWLYVLVGHGGRLPATELENSSYNIRCEKEVPGATNTPTPAPTRTPRPTGEPTDTPTPTLSPSEKITIRSLTTPTPAPVDTPVSSFASMNVIVYYDANGDRQPGAGEGVSGISVHAYESATNQLLTQGMTNSQGAVEFTVNAQGPVRVSVPFFGFSQLVTGETTIYLRVPYQLLPGTAP